MTIATSMSAATASGVPAEGALSTSGVQAVIGAAERAARFGHYQVDIATWSVTWSDGVATIFGRPRPPGNRLGLDEHIACYNSDDAAACRSALAKAVAGPFAGGPYTSRGRVLRPDGSIRHVLAQGTSFADTRGRLSGTSGILVDVTDAVEAEQAAQESSQFLRATLRSMDQGILMVGPDQVIRFHNQRTRDLLGLPDRFPLDGICFADLLAFQENSGEFTNLSPEHRSQLPIDCHEAEVRTYTRRRPNGVVLEIRTSPLPEGGFVRTYTDVSERHRRDAAMAESERRFRLLAESTTDTVIWCDLDSRRRYVSPAAKALLGYEPEDLVGTKPIEFVHPDDKAEFCVLIAALQRGELDKVTSSQRYRRRDGSYVWVEISFSLIRDPASNQAIGWVGAVRDISDRKAAEDALRLSEQRLAFALDSGGDGLWSHDLIRDRVVVLGRWWSILGYGEDEIAPTLVGWHKHTHPDDRARYVRAMIDHLQGRSDTVEVEYRVRTKSGAYVWTLARGKIAASSAEGTPTLLIGTYQDITRRKEAELALARLAHHDSLTSLPTRAVLQERLSQEIEAVDQEGGSFAVLVCDLDRFKAVNDALGHAAGDELLRIVAQRLAGALGRRDLVARVGGDEFTILLDRSQARSEIFATARRLITSVGQPITLSGRVVEVGVSIGIAFGNSDARTVEKLCACADMAMYVAKASGRNAFRAYESGMERLLGRAAPAEPLRLEKAVGWR